MNQNDCWQPRFCCFPPAFVPAFAIRRRRALCSFPFSIFPKAWRTNDLNIAKIEFHSKYSRQVYGFLCTIHLHVRFRSSARHCLISPVLYFGDLSSGTSGTFCCMMLHTLSWSYPQLPNKLRSKLQPFDQPSPGVQRHLAQTTFWKRNARLSPSSASTATSCSINRWKFNIQGPALPAAFTALSFAIVPVPVPTSNTFSLQQLSLHFHQHPRLRSQDDQGKFGFEGFHPQNSGPIQTLWSCSHEGSHLLKSLVILAEINVFFRMMQRLAFSPIPQFWLSQSSTNIFVAIVAWPFRVSAILESTSSSR